MELIPMGYDLHLRHVGTDGKAYVACHRVWDGARFFETRVADANKANAEAAAEGKPARAAVFSITRAQYLAERKST